MALPGSSQGFLSCRKVWDADSRELVWSEREMEPLENLDLELRGRSPSCSLPPPATSSLHSGVLSHPISEPKANVRLRSPETESDSSMRAWI